MPKTNTTINISSITIIKFILILFAFYFLVIIRDILALLFFALILASAIDPWVDWMQSKKINRGLGVFIIYAIMFGVIGLVLSLIIPPISAQMKSLTDNFPLIFEKVISIFSSFKDFAITHGILQTLQNNFGSINSNIQQAAGGIFSTVSGIVNGVFSFFLVLVMTFYMVVEENAVKKIIWSIAPKKSQAYAMDLINRMQAKIGLWLRGQLILSFIIFVLTYIGLLILGVDYALVLAMIAGLTEFVPYLGPILASIPAIFLSLTQSYVLAILVGILYYIIQLMENNFIVPSLMRKVVGLNPIVSIAVLLIGYKVAGVVGAIVSIPVTTAVNVLVNDYFERKNKNL